MSRLASILLSALLLGLAGCSTTVFESMPTGHTTDCDPAWPGRWKPVAMPDDDPAKSKDVLEISADCRTATMKSDSKPKPLHLTLIDSKAGQFLQVNNDNGDPDCIGAGTSHCGYVLLRYERDGDIIRLYDPDHATAAVAIAKGSIKGYSAPDEQRQTKTSTPTYRNFVAGDAGIIENVLRRHPQLFNSKPMLVLRHLAAPATPKPATATLPTDAPPAVPER